jgi:hypothetical protein
MTARDVSAEYAAGLWVPSYYGLKFRIAKKNARFPPAGRVWTETDPSRTFATLADAQAAADARNGVTA